jgi:hypothetical protein
VISFFNVKIFVSCSQKLRKKNREFQKTDDLKRVIISKKKIKNTIITALTLFGYDSTFFMCLIFGRVFNSLNTFALVKKIIFET